ncbi:MAG: glutamine--fructose-6-phosphate transaminase (isomerizing) [Anaerolineae bacterium]|nr:glutamine--fructose-6-phosphate transaminase (isomerizing) [Anaerolineae bacterium]
MCGIVGYVGPKEATPIILNGLKRLEYRGYDSAGIAVIADDQVELRRNVGKLENLERHVQERPLFGHLGVGHTRWATHGQVLERNAHPHISMDGRYVVVHNGIVENYLELREQLKSRGVVFTSDTDTEVIVHLIAEFGAQGLDLTEATRQTCLLLRGAAAIVVLSGSQPDRLIAVRVGNAGGVTIGIGEGEMFIASDMPAILEHTRRMIFLESRQMITVTAAGYQMQTLTAEPIKPQIHNISWDPVSAARGEYRHFMQKEMFEQARSITDTIRGRIDFASGCVELPDLILNEEEARRLKRIVTVACGTSLNSGLVGKFMLEKLAQIPVETDYGSEYRYRDPILDPDCAVLAITQSGETVDTLAAMEEARNKGAKLWSIVNVIGSQAMRSADGHITMQAGPEIGVCSTKTFTTSIVDQYLLALYLGQLRGTLTADQMRQYAADLAKLPDLVGRVIDSAPQIEELAEQLYRYEDFLYLGRGINYPIALEGALKLKEISYIHAEGYPAGEMKHGPIALIDEKLPVLTICVKDAVYEKMISQIEQAKARRGIVIAVATEGDQFIASKADHVMYVPEAPELLSPILTVLPLQLLAYYIAVRRGCDVDQPRNLAKSVTVE